MQVSSLSIKQTLINRDGITADEAQDRIDECKRDLAELLVSGNPNYEDVVQLGYDHFGLEPDYLDEMLFGMV